MDMEYRTQYIYYLGKYESADVKLLFQICPTLERYPALPTWVCKDMMYLEDFSFCYFPYLCFYLHCVCLLFSAFFDFFQILLNGLDRWSPKQKSFCNSAAVLVVPHGLNRILRSFALEPLIPYGSTSHPVHSDPLF